MARECDRPDGPTEVAFGGARGGGKSWISLAQVVADDCTRVSDLKFLYLRKVGKAGKEAVHDLRRQVLHSVPHEYKAQANALILPSGSRVILGHFQNDKDIDNYLGLEYDGALIEEATQLSSRKVRDIATCVRSSKPAEVWRPRIYYTTNPGNIGHAWFKARFIDPYRADTETTTRFIPATVRDNAFVNAEYRATLEGLTGWQRRAWLDGDWDIAAGQFFTTFSRTHHVLAEPIPIPESWRVWLGFDYGWTHYTTATLLAESGDGVLYVVAEYGERRRLPERHAAAIRALCERHGIALHRLRGIWAGADVFARKHTGGTVADDYRAYDLRFRPANDDRVNGAAEILRRLGDPEGGIEPTLFLFPACVRTADCLAALEHDPHRPEDVRKVDCDDDGLGGDDFYDSFRYACMVARNLRKVEVFV